MAFYSDCRHEVKPVRAGYRIVLTYNLLLGAETATSGVDPDPELVAALALCLDQHFAASGDPDRAVGVLCRQDELLGCAIAALRATSASQWRAVGLDAVATHSAVALDARLARPSRDNDDWSIGLPEGCGCELCDHLRGFLQDPTQTRLEWPLAKDRRAHVHGRIDTAELPLHHQTRRVGRPYTLVLTKTNALFEREAQERHRDRQNLAWLTRNRVDRAARRRRGSR